MRRRERDKRRAFRDVRQVADYRRAKRAGQIRIGYVGSITHAADLAVVEKALWKIMRRYPQVHFVSAGQYLKPHEEFLDRCEWDRGIAPEPGESGFDFMVRYYQLIESLDIDIARRAAGGQHVQPRQEQREAAGVRDARPADYRERCRALRLNTRTNRV